MVKGSGSSLPPLAGREIAPSPPPDRKVDIRLSAKRNSNAHGARPVHQIISIMKWIRTSRLSIKYSLALSDLLREVDAKLDHAVVALVLFARRPATTNPLYIKSPTLTIRPNHLPIRPNHPPIRPNHPPIRPNHPPIRPNRQREKVLY